MTTRPFHLAIVGGGGISRAHVHAAKSSSGTIVISAVVDPAETARKAVADATGARPFPNIDELLAAESDEKVLDGIVVCTPPSVRIPIVAAALGRGIAVLSEKPLAHTPTDAQQLARMSSDYKNATAVVGYCHRFVPAVREMKRQIEAGELGTMLRFENTFACSIPGMKDRWMSDPAVSGGGSFIDTGCHSLDLYNYLFGQADVVGATIHREWRGRGESNATVLLRGTGKFAGMSAVIQSGWLEPARFTLTVVGTKGLLRYDYDRPTELVRVPSEGSSRVLPVESHELRFDRQLAAFADRATGGPLGDEMADFAQGAKVAAMVDEVLKSAVVI
jgi:predicted dehydrogenase